MIITTPGANFLPEYQYIASLVFTDFLHIPITIKVGSDASKWHVQYDTYRLELDNIFFPEDNPEYYFHSDRLSSSAKKVSSLYSKDTLALLDTHAPRATVALDILGTIFFLLTSFEDHCGLPRDEHNRLCAHSSWMGHNNLLHRAIVDELLLELLALLDLHHIRIPFRHPGYQVNYSCDIDVPMKWHNMPTYMFLRHLAGSLIKRQSFPEFFHMVHAKINVHADPFFSFLWLLDTLKVYNLQGSFYFMGGASSSQYDVFYSLHSGPIKKLLHQLAHAGHSIGFHPSYKTLTDQSLFASELNLLRQVAPTKICEGRHHYLRFLGASTWRMWEAHNLTLDSSLGFSKAIGFRCGTAREYQVFDVEQRKPLALRERPLLVMDGTLLDQPAETGDFLLQQMKHLSNTVRKHGGHMTLLWHNSMLFNQKMRQLLCSIFDIIQ